MSVEDAIADAHRREWALVLAATARVAGDIDLAEECVQDAYLAALEAWTREGVPNNPGAWLTVTARRKALDAHRRARTAREKLPLLVVPEEDDDPPDPEVIPDDRLRLIFTCCHPALAREAQVALTLRLVGGLTTAEIARAFLVSEATMAARVTRAKKKISTARIAYRVPDEAELPDRLDAVLTVLHLIFTTGHTALNSARGAARARPGPDLARGAARARPGPDLARGAARARPGPTGTDLVRADLVERAVELTRMLRGLMPDEREVLALLALFTLTDARRATRTGPDGRLLLLEEQDRTLWNRVAIDEGTSLVQASLRGGRPGRFALQAAIAALHAEAPSYDETDWRQVLGLYDVLLEIWPSPVVALNRLVAVSMVEGPAAALEQIEELENDGRLAGYPYLPSTKADILRRLRRPDQAAQAYRAALALTENEQEREFLARRLAEVARDRA